MTTTAILLDLDETLVVEEASVEAAFLATCERARERFGIAPAALTASVRTRARELWRAEPTIDYCLRIGLSSWEGLTGRFPGDGPGLKALREWVAEYRRRAWSRALADHGVDDPSFADRLATTFIEERSRRHVAFAEVEGVLTNLKAGHKLGLVTNGTPDLQWAKLDGAGLARYFDAIVISADVGVGKPAPEIFMTALDTLAVAADQAVMVGDNLRRDVEGAQQVGIRGVWLNRTGRDGIEGVTPDAQIADLTELPGLLD